MTSHWRKNLMLSSYKAISLLYGPCFFPSDAANLADTPRAPGYLSVGQRSLPRVHMRTRDHLGQENHLLLSSRNI